MGWDSDYATGASCLTVAGFFLLVIFSLRRSFGKFLMENFDFKVVQTWKGCVIGAQ